ncbi:ADP-ribosylglycohydrolase family protein [Bacteroides sedimenti]|uniref:ADP-ribosylglycohydrolase family protein n=1 Tax=Bacteroides sedimenti TaxID=2136147 RepID=A0ABN6Z034_9BACE
MIKNRLLICFFVLVYVAHSASGLTLNDEGANIPHKLTMSKSTLLDKVKGGWAGKTIGCTYGGPVEFLYNGTMVQDYVPLKWNDESVKWYYDNFPGLYDDVYVNLTFVDVFDRLGLNAPADSFAIAFAHASYPLWHANQVARNNVLNGIMPPASGNWLNNPHADDIDFQIESDFAGIMSPGMPNASSAIADKVGHIMNYGNGWYGGVFVAAMLSIAYTSDDVEYIVSQALKTIPAKSTFYQCISDVIKWHKLYPSDWKQTWFECQKKWSNDIGCPDGVFVPLDIDALINSAYVAIGLLYGGGDFAKSLEISTRCGQDADCNPSTVGGILGVMLGYSKIPEVWKKPLLGVGDRMFSHSNFSLNKTYSVSYKQALDVISANGGKVTANNVEIKCQTPVAVKYEQAFEGHFPKDKLSIGKALDKVLDVAFTGKGVVFKGYVQCSDNNYIAELGVMVDGKDMGVIKLPVSTQDSRKVDLYWIYQLKDEMHKVSFKWLNPNPNAQVYFGDAIIYAEPSVIDQF